MQLHSNPYKTQTFDEQIQDVFEKKGKSLYKWLTMSEMPQSIANLGLEGERIVVARSTVRRHRLKAGHLSNVSDWVSLADKLDNPIAFGDREEGHLWLYYDFGNGNVVKVVIEKEVKGIKARANNVLTAFYRDKSLDHDIEIGKAQKINQSSERRHQLPSVLSASTGST